MPKRKRAVNSRQKRENDKKRKRQQRQKTAPGDVPADQTLTDSSVPCRTEEEAVSASPGNFPGLGFMGFPPKEEKPLARVQASPRVKMHSPAPRLPSPRGSLFVREQDKAPSPDSLEWVCAPPRASGPDTVHVSGPAGQAQLETSMYGGTSRKIKDEGNLTVNKKETKRKSNRNENGNNEKHTFSDRYNDGKTEKTSADLWRQKSSKEGKTECGFFAFDSHSRSSDGMLSVTCSMNCIENDRNKDEEEQDAVVLFEKETVKARSKLKYKFDEAHRIQVNEASTKRYRENKTYRDAKLNAAAEKYESDVSFRSKRKASSKNQYDSSPAKKARIKERITNQKSVKRAKLENQDEIVKLFKEKAVQGIDYSCCCCDRLLFKNQVQKCEQHNYAKNEHAANVADLCIQDKFAKDSNYVFFSQFMSDLNQVIEKTQISIRKSVRRIEGERKMTANMVQNPEILSKMMKNDEALRFMQPIRGTPAYWSAAQKDLFAMLRQLGIPTWFCSFSAAEHRWSDAIATILRQQNDSRDPSKMDWAEKNEVLRSNPVTVARMFEHRFHVFQTEVIFSSSQPIGKVSDYFQRVEFQQRGSPHMHCLYWIENAPKLDENGEEEVCNFIDKYVSCAIPSDNEDLELKNIILSVQQHSKKHSKSCRKKGTECRFNFPRPPSTCTFINSPNEQDTLEDDADAIQLKVEHAKAKQILLQVWNEVQDEENGLENTEQIFEKLGLTQSQYIEAHRRLAKKTSVVLRRNPSELWTNQYNPCLLKCWDANMDIQFVLDPFSCIVYIISYISKSEREMGMVLKQTKIEAEEGNESARTTLKKIGSAYLNHREVSAQEAVYRVCNLKMKECSRKVVFVPVGENPTRLTKPLSQIKRKRTTKDDDEDEEDDEDIWMTNIVERYENRPNEPFFQNMCLAEFCSEFRVLAKSQVPKTHNENVYELQNSKGFIQKRTRTQPAIIRYPRFDAEKMSEKYYQSLLQLFLPYWGINQLKPPGFDQYDTFYENGYIRITAKQKLKSVKSIVDENKARYSQNEDVIAQAQENFENIGVPEDAWANLCPETELMRHELSAERNVDLDLNATEELPDMQSQKTNSDVLYKVQQNTQSKEEITIVLQNLNETQMKVFYMVREWCLKKSFGEKLEPMHIFITGGAGTGKSHLIKAIHYEASRLLGKQLTTPDSVSVLLTAFTGTAAFNIGGNTIHHLFSLPKHMPLPYEPLREQSLSEMRVQLADLHILVIDEISMVYKRLLYYIHERLVQIKKCKEPFGGVSVIAVGDFYQLPPVKQRKDERLYKENPLYPFDYWVDLFKEVELTEIMRQREDIPFAEALNTLRTREIKQSLEEQTNSILRECIREGPDDVLHVYATNDEVNAYNLTMLKKKCEEFVEINAQDFTKDKSTGKLNMRSKPFTRSKTDSLPSSLLLGLGAKVMLTRNCNVGDGLVNGVMGVVSKFVYGQRHAEKSVVAVEVLFHNMNVGKKTGKRSRNGNLVMIERIQEDMKDQKTNNVVRHQFPLRLSWACTAHKVQGLTVDKVVVNLDRSFSPGQGYVALSRVTSKEGLFIDSDKPELIQKKIYADPEKLG
ncbi:uncharacterized protein LOC128191648 [Crassostrea angulata]|uniref:uncharacterized protein LOC128191648 n=1 Tax=Magallana angulata TaxID=2784310 RepID=UPI0022B0A0A9|nr:uncharacterized protein LOC128191648 [Crassostrea angulata]